MTLTMVGASMLWVGWFGFNAGSNLEANGGAALAMINTFIATAGAVVAWVLVEAIARGKASMLGAASGVVAGLVAVTPAAGFVGPMGAIVLGADRLRRSATSSWRSVKNKFGYDDSLDVFGIHGIGGIIGAIGTGIFASSSLGGIGYADGVTMGGAGLIRRSSPSRDHRLVRRRLGDPLQDRRSHRRPAPDRRSRAQGLDLTSHGEAAYHS